jgi:hypothetical protein
MTKVDYLNTATDLRRIAFWLAKNQNEKKPLISKFYANAWKNGEVKKVLKHFKAEFDPETVLNRKDRLFLAEQLLVSSNRLQNLGIE